MDLRGVWDIPERELMSETVRMLLKTGDNS